MSKNWMKIEIWDLQGPFNIVVQLGPVENDMPYLHFFKDSVNQHHCLNQTFQNAFLFISLIVNSYVN